MTSSHSGQLDLALLASSEVVRDQAQLDKMCVHFNDELEQLSRSVEERVVPILDDFDDNAYDN